MKYVIMTNPNGFQLKGDAIAEYGSTQEAMKHMGPGDMLVPIEDCSSARVYSFQATQRTKGHEDQKK